MITLGDFRNNVFTKSSCKCKFCTYRNQNSLICTNTKSNNYLSCMAADGSCEESKLNCDEIWLIVRSLKDLDYRKDLTMMYVPELSPSPELYGKYLKWKANGEWCKDVFEKQYVPEFLCDMCQPDSRAALEKLAMECKNKNILLACYCGDDDICHRSIVLGILQGMGVPTNSESDYSHYYKMYMNLQQIENERLLQEKESKKFYLLVAGSRGYTNYKEMQLILDRMLENYRTKDYEIIFVSGGAQGADSLAAVYAKNNNYETVIMPADWAKEGKKAGYLRNEKMHKFIATPDNRRRGCICFWDGESPGTKHNFRLAQKYNTQIKVYDYVKRRFLEKDEFM